MKLEEKEFFKKVFIEKQRDLSMSTELKSSAYNFISQKGLGDTKEALQAFHLIVKYLKQVQWDLKVDKKERIFRLKDNIAELQRFNNARTN